MSSTMHKVLKSGQVAEFGYDAETKKLTVIYHSGGYDYVDVPASVFEEMVKQNTLGLSMGSFVAMHIKPRFKYTRHPGTKEVQS